MKSYNNPVPSHLFDQFNDALMTTNGRLWSARNGEPGIVRVDYSYESSDDYIEFADRYKLISTPIKETYRNARWRVIMRRSGLRFLERRLNLKREIKKAAT